MTKNENVLSVWLRWIAVLPGALLAGFLITFPLHFILYVAFADGGFLFGLIPLPAGSNETLERALYPFAIAITFIIAGYKIAPKHRFQASVGLGVLYAVTFGAVAVLQPYQSQLEARSLLAFIGMLLGVYWAWRQSKLDRRAALEKLATEHAQATVDALNHPDTLAMWERRDEEIEKMAKAELARRKREADSKQSATKRLITLVSTKGKTSKEVSREVWRNYKKYKKVEAEVLRKKKSEPDIGGTTP